MKERKYITGRALLEQGDAVRCGAVPCARRGAVPTPDNEGFQENGRQIRLALTLLYAITSLHSQQNQLLGSSSLMDDVVADGHVDLAVWVVVTSMRFFHHPPFHRESASYVSCFIVFLFLLLFRSQHLS